MILDYFDPSAPDDYECDICIIGAGPAGITIANAFAGSRFNIVLLESGGLGSERATHALNEGESVGMAEFDPGLCRLRAFGGSSRLWGGGCVPLARLDLERRDWVPGSGWPMDFDELATWCGHARRIFGIDSRHGIGDGSFATGQLGDTRPFREEQAVDRICYESPTRFQSRYTQLLEHAGNITLLLHANLVELAVADDAGRVQTARIASLGGRRGSVRARQYVLAAGGIENARLLLSSNSVQPEGLGNRHGQVGRYFMDHPRALSGHVMDGDFNVLVRPCIGEREHLRTPLYREISLADATQRRLRLLNARARPLPVTRAAPAGLQALRDLRASFRAQPENDDEGVEHDVQRALDTGLPTPPPQPMAASNGRRARLALCVGMHPGHVAGAIARKLRHRPVDRYSHVEVMGYFEQSPNPHSRITLGQSRDALGMRKVRVDWRFTDLDYASYRTSATLLGEEAAQRCGGRFQPAPWVCDPGLQPPVVGTAHHLGSTRMADRPEAGVVDRDCRVHGVDNLHVAGSSVFPTGGWAFPTFTIAALGLRLADRLRTGLEMVGL